MKLKPAFDNCKTVGYFCAPFLLLGVASVTVIPPAVKGVVYCGSKAMSAVEDGMEWVGDAINQRSLDPQ